MLQLFHEAFAKGDFVQNPANKLMSLDSCDLASIDVREEAKKLEEIDQTEYSKVVLTKVANNEELPFVSDQFDAYISNLSVFLVPNHQNQLSSAYRVLKKGGRAALSTWGRQENSEMWTFLPKVMEAIGHLPE